MPGYRKNARLHTQNLKISIFTQDRKRRHRDWFSYNRRYRFDRPGLRPIARIGHERFKRSRSPQSPQALTIVYVMFSYNRPNRKTTF